MSASNGIPINRALDGTATGEEFKVFINEFVSHQNTLNERSVDCALSRSALDFSSDGELIPVIPYNEIDKCDRWVEDSITFSNNSKKLKRNFYITCRANPKFKLMVSQREGEVRPGRSIQIFFRIQVHCTTKVYQLIKVSLCPANSKSAKVKGKVPPFVQLADTEQTESEHTAGEKGRLWLAFKLESGLSNQVDWDEIKVGDRIAKGGFGTVFQATWRGVEVAVKVLNTQELVEEEKDMVKREMLLMSRLASPYIVTFMGSTLLPTQPWSIIMEYVSGGSLTDLLKKHNNDITPRFKIKLLLDIVAGLTYLHAHSIYHRDIKPDNMLVLSAHETAVNLKITDFGTSKVSAKKVSSYQMLEAPKALESAIDGSDILRKLNQEHSSNSAEERRITRGVGTLIYQAPEILEGADQSEKIDKTDVYAFGLLMWEVWTAVEPYSQGPTSKFTKWDLEAHVKSGHRPDVPTSMPKGYREIMEDCWSQNADLRPPFDQIQTRLRALFAEMPQDQELGLIRRRVQHSHVQSTGSPGPYRRSPDFESLSLNDSSVADIHVVVNSRGVPVPFGGDLAQIGWAEDMGRPEAERRLYGQPPGTFIIRWSGNTSSYVLTYSKGSAAACAHIAYILPVAPSYVQIQADKEDGEKQTYANIFAYAQAMKESGIVTRPCSMT